MSTGTEQVTVDVNTMPMDELKALVEQEAIATATNNTNKTIDGERPRDEQGRFIAATEAAVVEKDEEQPAIIYRKEIDLGDGSGVQVFKSDTLEGLNDELATAHANATKKIRELNLELKAFKSNATAKEPTADEEFILSQELTTNPSKTIQKLVDQELKRREQVAQSSREQGEKDIATSDEFMARNPEYSRTPANSQRLVKYLETYKLGVTVENLETAFTDLNKSGLLELKSAEVSTEEGATDDTETNTATARIEQTVERTTVSEPVQRKKAASGLSARGRVVAPPARSTEPTEKDMYSMSMEELKELGNKQ